ncbi:RICIN domain-containing protein [Kitasatospora sp. NPDC101183]|uniref:RICIN domain-containing protein n=1 Tax=Kitasatospora sp. NPDC101183 TaxID=3364100 RepID=UPI0037FE371B
MRNKVVGLFVVAAAAVGALLPTTASAATLDPPERHYGSLGSLGTSQCMVVLANGSNGNHPTLYDCLPFADQKWYYPAPGSTGPITNSYSGDFLTAQGSTPGTPAFMYQYTGATDQQWAAIQIAPGVIRFRNAHSGLCLTLQRSAGAQAMAYVCADLSDQEWAAV